MEDDHWLSHGFFSIGPLLVLSGVLMSRGLSSSLGVYLGVYLANFPRPLSLHLSWLELLESAGDAAGAAGGAEKKEASTGFLGGLMVI